MNKFLKDGFVSGSSSETRDLGKRFAERILKKGPGKEAVVLGLAGELGAGKTTFVRGFARGLGIKKKITSPTYLIFTNYKPSLESFDRFYHVDAYRLSSSEELVALGISDILKNPKNIVLIEWADKVKKILPKNTLFLHFSHLKKEKRKITLN